MYLQKYWVEPPWMNFFGGEDTFQVWALTTSATVKIWKKKLPQPYYIKIKFLMIWVLLQSESPWQLNDAIMFFIYLLCFSVPGVFFIRNRLREYVPAIIASIMAKFEQIPWERFWNILKRSYKNHKNSEIACYLHNGRFYTRGRIIRPDG